jgi:hypothetical protein
LVILGQAPEQERHVITGFVPTQKARAKLGLEILQSVLEADDLRRLDDPLGRIGLGQLFDIEIHKGVKSQAESLLENGVVGIFTEDILLLEAAAGGLEALENREHGRHCFW